MLERAKKKNHQHPNSYSLKFSICLSSAVTGRYGLKPCNFYVGPNTPLESQVQCLIGFCNLFHRQSYQVACEIISAFSVANFLLKLTLMGALSIHLLNLQKTTTGGHPLISLNAQVRQCLMKKKVRK